MIRWSTSPVASADREDGGGDPFRSGRFAGRDRAGHRRLDGDVGLTGAMHGHDGVASYSWLGDLGVACAGEAGLTWPSRAASGVETAMPIAQAEVRQPSCRLGTARITNTSSSRTVLEPLE